MLVAFIQLKFSVSISMQTRLCLHIKISKHSRNNVSSSIYTLDDKPFFILGIFSPSVQNSQYLTQKQILEKIPQIESVSIEMPNVHYFGFDFSKFKRMPELSSTKGSGDVYNPVDKPSGHITSTLSRQSLVSKLWDEDIEDNLDDWNFEWIGLLQILNENT